MSRQPGNVVLFELRDALKLTQRDMAEEAGLSAGYICQVETGEHDLGRDAGLKILDAYRESMGHLRITLEDLLRGSRDQAA